MGFHEVKTSKKIEIDCQSSWRELFCYFLAMRFVTSFMFAAGIYAIIDFGDWKYYGYRNVLRNILWFGFFIFVIRTIIWYVKNMNKKAVKIIVHGLVHGVFYRQSTQEIATSLNLKGTVRNCNDGTVEIYAEGEEANLKKLMEWCRKGPPKAQVTNVVSENVPVKNFLGFEIIR